MAITDVTHTESAGDDKILVVILSIVFGLHEGSCPFLPLALVYLPEVVSAEPLDSSWLQILLAEAPRFLAVTPNLVSTKFGDVA